MLRVADWSSQALQGNAKIWLFESLCKLCVVLILHKILQQWWKIVWFTDGRLKQGDQFKVCMAALAFAQYIFVSKGCLSWPIPTVCTPSNKHTTSPPPNSYNFCLEMLLPGRRVMFSLSEKSCATCDNTFSHNLREFTFMNSHKLPTTNLEFPPLSLRRSVAATELFLYLCWQA